MYGAGIAVPPRPPQLCAGCPHGHVFTVLHELDVVVSGDIGCYSLGVLPPYHAMDTLVDMGASLTMAQGMDIVLGTGDRPRVAAVIGDSTFAHSGLTGLLNRMGRENSSALSYRALAAAVGVPPENVAVVDGHDKAAITTAIADLIERPGVKLLAAVSLCVIEAKDLRKVGKYDEKRAWRELELLPSGAGHHA